MIDARETITTKYVWLKGMEILRATKKQALVISLTGLLVPQLVFTLLVDVQGAATVARLRELTLSTIPGNGFNPLVSIVFEFLGRYAIGGLVLWVLFLGAYFGMVHLAVEYGRGRRTMTSIQALKAGMGFALPQGLMLTLLMMVITIVGQFMVVPAMIAAFLALAVPVILVSERSGAWRAFWNGVTLRYARQSQVSTWAVLLTLVTCGALVYGGILGTSMLKVWLIYIDEWLGFERDLWASTFPGLPFGPVYLISTLIELGLVLTLVTIVPFLTTALYFKVASGQVIDRV